MFASDESVRELVEAWTAGILPEKEWTHAAHVATCCYYVWHHSLAESYKLMREGLYKFNAAVGVPNSEERGYHETLTRFWCTLIFYKTHRGHYNSCLEAVNGLVEMYGKQSRADRDYYSFDVLKSKEARKRWMAPDVDCIGGVSLEAFRW